MSVARVPAFDIEQIVAGLIVLFDDRAMDIATCQVEQATGAALVSWSEIIENLSRKQSIR